MTYSSGWCLFRMRSPPPVWTLLQRVHLTCRIWRDEAQFLWLRSSFWWQLPRWTMEVLRHSQLVLSGRSPHGGHQNQSPGCEMEGLITLSTYLQWHLTHINPLIPCILLSDGGRMRTGRLQPRPSTTFWANKTQPLPEYLQPFNKAAHNRRFFCVEI